jgi:hypothetical protein
MGLTIHYNLSAPESWTSEEIHGRFEIIADYARHLGCAEVPGVLPAHEKQQVTDKLHKVGRGFAERYIPIHATEGWVLMINVGEGCEPFALGLCKYPHSWRCQHGHSMRRWHPTKISGEWQLSWFCKTQFAGKHGAAHFLCCHRRVVSLLDFCRKGGLEVVVRDEAGYWENRDEAKLLKAVRSSEAMLAAFGGLLKDQADPKSKRNIESPIFDYTNFEHLEHEGWQRFGRVFAPLLEKGTR